MTDLEILVLVRMAARGADACMDDLLDHLAGLNGQGLGRLIGSDLRGIASQVILDSTTRPT
ncbi:hypothetical protein ACSVIJ_19730 [Pseudomonas sp. NCHU5208]|uniref:hypothetical protein n=1 Tax=unclassified Pseudomonas TaxID=196821 RepID=UPI003F9A4CC6